MLYQNADDSRSILPGVFTSTLGYDVREELQSGYLRCQLRIAFTSIPYHAVLSSRGAFAERYSVVNSTVGRLLSRSDSDAGALRRPRRVAVRPHLALLPCGAQSLRAM